MEATIEQTIILKLSEEEAKWLKALMQNPIGVVNIEDECPLDKNMRNKFWYALSIIEDDII